MVADQGSPKTREPQYRPQVIGFPDNKDPSQVPLMERAAFQVVPSLYRLFGVIVMLIARDLNFGVGGLEVVER